MKKLQFDDILQSRYFSMAQVPPASCSISNDTCVVPGFERPKAFGDYQYFLSFGGDQYLDIPLSIDAAYGTRGLIVQCGHFVSQVSYEVAGYTALGENEQPKMLTG